MARTPVRATDFTGTNGTNLESFTGATVGGSTSWSQKQSGQGAGYIVIQSNRLGMAFGDGSRFVYHESAGSYSNDQYAKAVIQDKADSGAEVGVVVRCSGDTGTSADYYAVRVLDWADPTVDTYDLIKYTNNSETTLISATNQAFSNGDTIELEAITEGSDCRLRVYRNGVELANYLDTSSPLPAGTPGLYFRSGSSNQIRLDDWEGGDVTADGADEALSGSAITGGHGTASPGTSIGL